MSTSELFTPRPISAECERVSPSFLNTRLGLIDLHISDNQAQKILSIS